MTGRGKRREGGERGVSAIILYFSVKGRRLFEGQLLFEEIPYVVLKKIGLRMTCNFVFFKQVGHTLTYVKKG